MDTTERNMTLKIDTETMDLVFDDDGMCECIYGDETTTQCVRLTLQTGKESFPLDLEHGTAWEQILGRKMSDLADDEVDEIIREAIFQEDDVEQVDSLAVERDESGRHLDIAFTGTLYGGRQISTEVSI